MGRSWRWGGGRRRVAALQAPNLSGFQQSTDCILSMAGRRACRWWLPPLKEESASAKNWPHLSLGSLLVLATHSWLLVKKILAFDLSRCVELCRVFS